MKKRVSSLLLAVMMMVQLLPAPSAYAEELTCTHHTHDTACGWAEALQGVACSHTHDEAACYITTAKCAHICDDNCVIEEGKCTTHACDEGCAETQDNCVHFTTHDDTCGYVAAKEASACSYDASACELCKAAEAAAVQTTFDQMIAALPAPETMNPQDESQLETVHGQISAIVTFALENGLYTSQDAVTSQSAIAALLDAMYPKEQPDATYVAYIGETGYETLEDAVAAVPTGAAEATTITISAGTYTLHNDGSCYANKKIVFKGTEGVIFDATGLGNEIYSDELTFENVTIHFPESSHKGITSTNKVVFNNCQFTGTQTLYADTVVFNNCVFDGNQRKDLYYVWTYGAKNVTFTDCIFNTSGKAILVYNEGDVPNFVGNVTMTNCTFHDDGALDVVKAAVETGSHGDVNSATANRYNLTFTNCKANGFDKYGSSDSPLWGNKNNLDYKHLKVVIDGKVANAPKVTVSVDGAAATEQTIEDVVKEAEAAANGSTVELTATTSEVPAALITAVADSTADIAVVMPATVSTGEGTAAVNVKLDAAAVSAVADFAEDKNADDVILTVTAVANKPANAAEDAKIYDIVLTAGNDPITSFGDGEVTVTLPAPTLPDGKTYEDMRVYYYGNGFKTVMNAAISVDGAVFTTNHFSPYGTQTADASAWFDGVTGDVYTIHTAAELADFAAKVNAGESFAGKTVKLGDNIDLQNQEWTPIGGEGKPFAGTFDGDGKIISNLKVTGTGNYVGLFGYVGGNSEKANIIQNVTLKNVAVSGGRYVGGVAGCGFVADFSNCHVTGAISINGTDRYVGGIVGHLYGDVVNSSVTADTKGTISANYFLGGIVGFVGEGNTVGSNVMSGCTVKNMELNGSYLMGGIAGSILTGTTISGSTVSGTTITGSSSNSDYTGLLVGQNAGGDTSGDLNGALTYVINNAVENTTATAAGKEVTALSGAAPATVVGTGVTFDDSGKITGGTFEVAPPESSVAEGCIPVENADGTFGVKPSADEEGKVLYYVEHYIADKDETTGYKLHEREFQYGEKDAEVSYESYVKEAIQVGTVKCLFNEDKDEAHTGTLASGEGSQIVALKLYYDVAQTAYNPENVRYIVEHYKNVDGKYTLVEADTEMPAGKIGETVKAVAKDYKDYRVNEEASVLTGKLVKIEEDADIVTLKVCYDVDYKVIKGAGQTLHKGEKAAFTANIDYEKFTGVLIDGKKLSERHYEHRSGSTVIILKPSYTESLKARHTYTLTIQATDGQAETTFRVKPAPADSTESDKSYDSDSPKTGDTTNQGLWLAIAALGIAGLLASLFGKKYLIKRK